MIWQDMIITIASLLFTFSLFGQAYHGFKRKRGFIILRTSGLTALGLYAIGISVFTLSLYYSAIITIINATLWLTLFVQGIIYQNA